MKKDINNFKPGRMARVACFAALCALPLCSMAGNNPAEVLARSVNIQQNNQQVKGRVVDASGEPLIGVSVRAAGSDAGTVTDVDGNFMLQVPSTAKNLVISYVGFTTQTVPVKSTMNVVMKSAETDLNEVVVVGYGTQKKVNLTGAVTSVDFSKQLDRPVTTASAALASVAPGLQVMQSSGRPNGEGVGILIRGNGTLNNASPLVLVDGMEQDLADVNPNDIASISVLKDAASCAIYGNRGANGVILVTTKTGVKGKTHVTYSGRLSINSPTRLVPYVTNYADYMGFMNEAAENFNQSHIYSDQTIQKWRDAEKDPNGIAESGYPNYVAYPNTNWWDEIYQTKVMQEHNLSVLGNDGKTNYNISMSYLDNPGMIVRSGVKKYFLNLNVTSNVTDWLQIGAHAWGNHTDQDRDDVNNLSEWAFLKNTPGMYPFYDGKYGGAEAPEEDPQAENPLIMLNGLGDSYFKTNHAYATTFAQVKILKDFTIKTMFGYDFFQKRDKYVTKVNNKYSFSRDKWVGTDDVLATDNSFMYHREYYNWKWTNTINWAHTYAQKHEVGALFGFEEGKHSDIYTDVKKSGLIDQSITDLSTVTKMEYLNGAASQNRYRSWFGRVNYAYASRYLFEANFREDGSSKFAPGNRWGFFPSVSGGWRISEEPFAQNSFLKVFDNLKLRASYGELGNNDGGVITDYAWMSSYQQAYTIQNGVKVGALRMLVLPNENITWEQTATTNIGLDFATLNNRLTGTVDWYYKKTTGILVRPNVFLTLGEKQAPIENLADVTNQGVEVTLGWRDHIGDFYYNVTGNVAFNKNRVAKYRGTLKKGWTTDADGNKVYSNNIGDVSTGGIQRILEGHTINEYYLYKPYSGNGSYFNADGSVNVNGGPKDGMIRTEKDMEWLKAMMAAGHQFLPNRIVAKNGIWYGDYIFADVDGDGVYGDADDQDFTGDSNNPKINFGLSASAQWKGFDFSMLWGGSTGFKTYWREIGQNSSSAVYGVELPEAQAYDHYFYDPENPTDPRTNISSKNPRLTLQNPNQSDNLASTLYLYDCKFLKLRNVTLGYTLPASVTKAIYAQNVRVYFSGENLLTITPFKGMDPEMRTGEGYATMRSFSFGLNVTF